MGIEPPSWWEARAVPTMPTPVLNLYFSLFLFQIKTKLERRVVGMVSTAAEYDTIKRPRDNTVSSY